MADHWRHIMDHSMAISIAQHLERAKGCITDHRTLTATVAALQDQVQKYEAGFSLVDNATEELQRAEDIRKSLDLRQRIREWFRNAWKDILKWLGWTVAAIEAGYIIYITLKP